MGPLNGIKVIEIEGIGPGPFCGRMLADMGAEVILVQRAPQNPNASEVNAGSMGKKAIFHRGKRAIALDLKTIEGVDVVLKLIETADALIEGFRPGVMERLGLGPDVCLEKNPKLVYGRMTGWGQTGPLAHAAGHDINYLALSGALYYAGHDGEAPFTPVTMLGDTGGGGLMLAFGICAALLHAKSTGEGQVVDAAITDGSATLSTLLHSMYHVGLLSEDKSEHFFSGASYWYDSYECADGKYISIGAIEPKFYKLLCEKLELNEMFDGQQDKCEWSTRKEKLSVLIKTQTQSKWCELLEGTDVCFAPVLNFKEAINHPHNKARETFVEIEGITQPAPAPRLDKTPAQICHLARDVGADTKDILKEYGFSADAIEALLERGICKSSL